LGYTTWEYDSLTVNPGGEGLGVASVTLRNTGERAGREVVQLYLSPTSEDPRRPQRWLVGFAVAEAGPGEEVTVQIPLGVRSVQVWSGSWETVPGSYRVFASHSVAAALLSSVVQV
jgi:beta-glucosidase